MKILLVVKSKMMETLGPMYLSSVIKKAGHGCKIVALDEARDFSREWAPEIIGFSIMTGDMEKFKKLKEDIPFDLQWRPKGFTSFSPESNPRPKFIVGGPDPSFFPEGYDWADEICKGEGEDEIIRMITDSREVVLFPTIDSIPWADRSDFPDRKIRDFITTRGCPYNTCHYCYNEKWMKLFPEYEKVRVRDPKDVVAEIKSVNPEYVYFQDSVFGISMDWMREFAGSYIFELGQGTIDFNHGNGKEPIYPVPPYQCHLRPEMVTYERANLLKKSGCCAVRMALESASERLREMVGRKMSLDVVSFSMGLLRGKGIQTMLQNIIGLPTATIEDDLWTLDYNISVWPTYSWVSIYQPYPGTVLGDQCKEMGWYKGDYSDITDSFFETSHLEISPEYKEQLEILQKVFALCVDKKYLPEPKELTYKNLPNLIHKIMRKEGDNKLYLGLL